MPFRSFRSIYPVFTERIHVSGRQWVEPLSPTSCLLHAKIRIKVDLPVIGSAIERGIEQLIQKAYDDLPIRCAPGTRGLAPGAIRRLAILPVERATLT